jgi:hypothetical protein
MRFLRVGAQIAAYMIVFCLATALAIAVIHMSTSWWSVPMTTRLLGWTGMPDHMQPSTVLPYLFVLQPALMAGAWAAAACTPRLHRWRFLLATYMLAVPLVQLMGAVAFFEARVAMIHGQADPMLVHLAQTQALILCLALSAPGVLLATWHAALWRERRLAFKSG